MKYKKLMLISLLATVGIFTVQAESEIYSIYEYDSKYIGKNISINKPTFYISGLEYCNNLDENVAYNTDCIINTKAKYKLSEVRNNCVNCLDEQRLTKPRKIIYKEKLNLKVVESYSVQPSKLSMRLFNSKIPNLLLQDQDGNFIEMPEIYFELLKNNTTKNKEEEKVEKEYELFLKTNAVPKNYCFFEQIKPSNTQFSNIDKLINDFQLNTITVEKYEHCPPNKTKGIRFLAKDFNEYLTFNYYLNEWGVYGKWIN